MKRWMLRLGVCLFLAVVGMVQPSLAAEVPAIVVGRIFHIEGDLLRYVPAEKDWVAMVKDSPFGTEDTLYSGNQGKAELIIPNGTWIRIGNNTQIQFITFDPDLSEIDIASGVARFYNKSSDTIIKATSPFGYVLAYPETVFDFYVGENSVEVVPVKGKVSFVHSATNAKYEVSAGSPSILADQRQVSSDEGIVDPDWDRWNKTRENFWLGKARLKGNSVEYLPPSLQEESYALDENGRWEMVPYEGATHWFWRPTTVYVGWAPFTVGRWTDWYGDQCWIPAEPFGYITHHYGNWVFIGQYWYWAPPVVRVRIGLPLLNVGFFWYPGRVSWIHTGIQVGWIPLAPRETYYCRRNWGGPQVIVVTNAILPRININLRSYAYLNHAVVVNQNNLYRVNNYKNVLVSNIKRDTILNDYRAAPVVNNTVINNYSTIKQRFSYGNMRVEEKPHHTVIQHIQQNQNMIREGRPEKAFGIQERVKNLPEGKVDREARIEAPAVRNYLVPPGEVNRPRSELKLQKKEIIRYREGSEGVRPKVAPKPEQPKAKPGPPPAQPERVVPPRPGPQEQSIPLRGPERVRPERPVQPKPPTARPERVAPPRPGPQEQSIPHRGPERVRPKRPVQPEPPTARPERIVPPRPSSQEQPGPPRGPERVRPERPVQPEPPAARPERVAPPRPLEKETQPRERAVENPRNQKPVKKQIEKSKEPKSSEKD
jgi:hypothetical protein